MSRSRVTRRGFAAVAALALVASACGGDDGDAGEATADEPTATESATAEPSATEPAGTEAPTTEPSATEPSATEPPTTEGSGSDQVLTVWTEDFYVAIFEPIVADWEAETGIDVQFITKGFGEMQDEFVNAVPAGEGPDIFITPPDVNRFVSNGLIVPLELGGAEAGFNQVAMESVTVDGQIYAIPFSVENMALFRNVDLAPDPVATVEEAIAIGEGLGAEIPFALGQGPSGNFYQMFPMMSSFGVEIFGDGNTDGSNVTLDSPEGLEFAAALGDLGARGIMSPDITLDIALEAFTSGETPFLVDGPWQLSAIKDAGINYSIDPIPSLGSEVAAPFAGFYGVVQSAQAPNPVAASLFMTDFMLRTDTHIAISEGNNTAPALLAALEARSSDPDIAGFGAVGQSAIPIPAIPEMGQVWGPAGEGIVAILSGAGDPAELWTQTADRIRQGIEDAG